MAFLIKSRHRHHGSRLYIGVKYQGPVDEPEELAELQKQWPHVEEIHDSEIVVFHRLTEAKAFGFSSREEAELAIAVLPPTRNLTYGIIEVGDAIPS